MPSVVTEELSHGTPGVRRQVLQRGRIRGRGAHNDCVVHGVGVSKRFHDLCHGRTLLADGDVDAVQLSLLVLPLVETFLVDDRIYGNGRLSGLSITDDQLTLATADWHQTVDSLDSSLHGFFDGNARYDSRGLHTDTSPL